MRTKFSPGTVALVLIALQGFVGMVAAAELEKVFVAVSSDSQERSHRAEMALDGGKDTLWHSNWKDENKTHPFHLVIDLGKPYPLSGFKYVARKDGTPNGTVKDFEFFVSPQRVFAGEPAAKGVLGGTKTVHLDAPVTGRYVKFVAHSEVNGANFASAAELRLLSPGRVFLAKGAQVSSDPVEVDIGILARETLRYVETRKKLPELSAELTEVLARYEGDPSNEGIRSELVGLRRSILFSHPDLQFKDLVLNKRATLMTKQKRPHLKQWLRV